MAIRGSTRALLALGAAALAAGCAHDRVERPVPEVRTVEVVVQQPIPCPALAQLGPEPLYPDTDDAIRAAVNMAERAYLYVVGREMRSQRLSEYQAAAAACNF